MLPESERQQHGKIEKRIALKFADSKWTNDLWQIHCFTDRSADNTFVEIMDIPNSQIQDNEIQSAKLEDDCKLIQTHTSVRRQPTISRNCQQKRSLATTNSITHYNDSTLS